MTVLNGRYQLLKQMLSLFAAGPALRHDVVKQFTVWRVFLCAMCPRARACRPCGRRGARRGDIKIYASYFVVYCNLFFSMHTYFSHNKHSLGKDQPINYLILVLVQLYRTVVLCCNNPRSNITPPAPCYNRTKTMHRHHYQSAQQRPSLDTFSVCLMSVSIRTYPFYANRRARD